MKQLTATALALAAAVVMAGCSKPAVQPVEKPAAAASAQPDANAPAVFTAKSADGRLETKVIVSGKVASVENVIKEFAWNAAFASKTPKEPKNKQNEGHVIIQLDDKEPKYVGTVRTSLMDLAPGKHTLKVTVVNNDNSPAGAEATVPFEVK